MQVGRHEASRQTTKLFAKIAYGDGFTALKLDGVVDEHNQLALTVDALPKAPVLAVDMSGIRRLNSVGVRDWVNWLRAVRAKFPTVVLFDCPPPVMNEVNFVKNFAEGAYIASFAAPLYCTRCQKEESRLLETHRLLSSPTNGAPQGVPALPSFRCDRADCENALDDDEESYFAFLRTLPETPESRDSLVHITQLARAQLASAGAPLVPLKQDSDAGSNIPARRTQPLGSVGLGGVPRKSSGDIFVSPASPTFAEPPAADRAAADPPPLVPPPPTTVGGDWLFIAAMAAMVGVLGVLIYLILTLE